MAKSKLISVSCPKCGKAYRIYQANLGRRGICKQCGSSFSMTQRVNKPSKNKPQKIKPVVRSAPPTESQSKVKQVIQEAVEKPESIDIEKPEAIQKEKTDKPETIQQENTEKPETIQKENIEKPEVNIPKKRDIIETKNKLPAQSEFISNSPIAKKDLNVLSEQIKFLVTDGMKAYLVEKTKMDSDVTIADIKKFLEREKVIYGIVGDDVLQKFIDNRLNRIKPFLVARGTEPTEPKHGRVKYYFDTHPLKIIDPKMAEEDERIDFKERGEMPFVEKGTLIAERIPGIPGKNGKDVFGKRIEAKKAHHVTLRCGNGASLSEDKRLIHARINGMPVSTAGRNERVDVLPQYYVKGDVNMKTGNIRFNGPVVVAGTVQSGFKVRCASLEAKELFRADVRVNGDINVQGGVVGSKVVCMGSFKSKFVKGSVIECEEDIVVSNGIVDSKVETRNNCIVENNKILTSDIMAFKDIITMHLGSKTSPGCRLTIGMDPVLVKKMKQLKDENATIEEELTSIKEDLDIDSIDELKEELQNVQKKIDDLEPTLSEAKSITKNLIQQYKKVKKSDHTENLPKILETIKVFSIKIGPAKEELNSLIKTRHSIKESLVNVQNIVDKIEINTTEIQEINRKIQTSDQTAKVLVRGDVYPGTIIQGVSASKEIFDQQSFVLFEELQIFDENNLPQRQIELKTIEKHSIG